MTPPPRPAPPLPWRVLALVWLAFTGVALGILGPAIDGPFVSDDVGYLVSNRWVQEPSPENLAAILDPRGDPAAYTANYAPVHLLLHSLEWQLFGSTTRGYHVVNAAVHAGVATLLIALFGLWGIPRAGALAGGALFLTHPASVEPLAWISQLKTLASLAFAVAALVLLPRRPALAAGLFGLALLTKVAAIFALPVAGVWMAMRARADGTPPVAWRWLLAWVGVTVAVAIPEWIAFQRLGATGAPLADDTATTVRTIIAIAARYLVMAASSFGVSAFHDPPRSGVFDPWWLAGLAGLAIIGARALYALWTQRVEAAFWVWAAGGWAPVSQIFPFLYPIADRYLYFITPGLLGAALSIAAPRLRAEEARRKAPIVLALLLALCVGFGVRSQQRARIWTNPALLLADAARNYPEGIEAHLLAASAAALAGDEAGALAALLRVSERGWDRFELLEHHPSFARMRERPEFRALVVDVAGNWIENVRRRPTLNQAELRMLGRAHSVRGETDQAIRRLEEALEIGGPWDAEVRAALEQLRRAGP